MKGPAALSVIAAVQDASARRLPIQPAGAPELPWRESIHAAGSHVRTPCLTTAEETQNVPRVRIQEVRTVKEWK